jgi:hypothetical protein
VWRKWRRRTYLVVHCAEVDAQRDTDYSCEDTDALDDAVDFDTFEEAEEDGAEWEDEAKGREHDGSVRGAHLVAVARCVAVSLSVRRCRKSYAAGNAGGVRRRLRHVGEEGASCLRSWTCSKWRRQLDPRHTGRAAFCWRDPACRRRCRAQ